MTVLRRSSATGAALGSCGVTFGGRYTDLCYGYNAFWRRVLPVIERRRATASRSRR